MAVEPLVLRHLFGGALQVKTPPRFDDVSDVRPVPDHQEVFADGAEDQSLVIEIVERCGGVADEAAAQHFFDDLATVNAAAVSVAESCVPLSAEDVPCAPPGTAMWLVTGRQTIAKGRSQPGETSGNSSNEVQVLLAVLRLQSVASEMLVSLNSPITIHEDSASAPHTGAGPRAAHCAAPALMREMLRSMRVLDWSLFGAEEEGPQAYGEEE